MIELIFKVPFYVWKDLDETGNPIPLNIDDKIMLLDGCLNQDPFYLEDLANYADDSLSVVNILPIPLARKDDQYFIEIKAYSASAILSNRDIQKIKEDIESQVSDGWGESGFDLYAGLKLDFKYEEIRYTGHNIITEEDYKEIITNRAVLRKHANIVTFGSSGEMSESSWEDLAKSLEGLVGSLQEIANKLEKINKEKN